jgi:2-dehydro-3-deoxyphosphogalactonate aldolase
MPVSWSDVVAGLPLVAVLRGVTPAEAVEVAAALYDGGIRCVEVTLNSPRPLASIAAIRDRFDGVLMVGAGTVLRSHEVGEAAAAGAQIIVSPNMDPAVIGAAKTAGLTSLPGVFTPSEAFAALAAGADALKLFLAALLAVLPPGTSVLPVGGIEPAGMARWRLAGAVGFGIGGSLFKAGRHPDEVRERARAFAAAWAA